MELINKIYKQQENNLDSGKPMLIVGNLNEEEFTSILQSTYLFDTDLRYSEVKDRMSLIFQKLGLGLDDYVLLDNMVTYNSRFNSKKIGKVMFNYWISEDNYLNNFITYYLNGEMFNGNDRRAFSAGIRISGGNTSLYYSVGDTSAHLVKYEIELSNGVKLTREFSNDEVFFIFETVDNRFMIKINRKSYRTGDEDYYLNNEAKLLEYLTSLSSYDIDSVYDKLCEISLGSDVSGYSEITLCESKKIGTKWKEVNLLVLRNGNAREFIRTVGNRVITINKFGNWKYYLDDELTEMTIDSSIGVNYDITSSSEDVMNDYMDGLFQYDVSKAQREVEDVKKLIREKYTVKKDSN